MPDPGWYHLPDCERPMQGQCAACDCWSRQDELATFAEPPRDLSGLDREQLEALVHRLDAELARRR